MVCQAFLNFLILWPAPPFCLSLHPQFLFKISFVLTYLAALGLLCGMWDLVPCPGIEPRPLVLGAQCLTHWMTREVPTHCLLNSHTSFRIQNKCHVRKTPNLVRFLCFISEEDICLFFRKYRSWSVYINLCHHTFIICLPLSTTNCMRTREFLLFTHHSISRTGTYI